MYANVYAIMFKLTSIVVTLSSLPWKPWNVAGNICDRYSVLPFDCILATVVNKCVLLSRDGSFFFMKMLLTSWKWALVQSHIWPPFSEKQKMCIYKYCTEKELLWRTNRLWPSESTKTRVFGILHVSPLPAFVFCCYFRILLSNSCHHPTCLAVTSQRPCYHRATGTQLNAVQPG